MNDIVNNIEVDEHIYDPYMDLYIIFGHSVTKRAKPYCLAWQLREEDKLTHQRSFKHASNARADFNAAALGEIQPDFTSGTLMSKTFTTGKTII